MDFRLPNHKPSISPNSRPKSCDRWNGVQRVDRHTVIFRDSDPGGRNFYAHSPKKDLRQIPILAQLISPFTHDKAEQFATQMLSQFGSIGNALAAPLEQLLLVTDGDIKFCEYISAARNLMETALFEKVRGDIIATDDPAFLRYLRLQLSSPSHEQFHAVFVDELCRYIQDECLAVGQRNAVQTRIRPLFKRALDLGASGIILAHNHPSGSIEPSEQDISSTRQIAIVAQALELQIVDHLILTDIHSFSMKRAGLI